MKRRMCVSLLAFLILTCELVFAQSGGEPTASAVAVDPRISNAAVMLKQRHPDLLIEYKYSIDASGTGLQQARVP